LRGGGGFLGGCVGGVGCVCFDDGHGGVCGCCGGHIKNDPGN